MHKIETAHFARKMSLLFIFATLRTFDTELTGVVKENRSN